MNGLDDFDIIRALNRASQAGVTVDLYVRGICALRPGIPGVSDRIRVRSIVGRFLEHSRMFYFANGASDPLAGDFFIGSADWMGRNLHKRVEIVVPIAAKSDRRKLWNIFEVLDQDNCQSWELNADSSYSRRHPLPGDPVLSSQERLMEQTREEEALHLHLP